MKHHTRIVALLLLCVVLLTSLCGCKPQEQVEAENSVPGTWYYVNGKDEITNLYIRFEEDGTLKAGMTEGFSEVTDGEVQEFLSSFFGDVSSVAKKLGLDLNLSTKGVSEFFRDILTIQYEVKDTEEIIFSFRALKLIKLEHVSQYSFKQNGDMVLNGIVFRKK